jgi:hypothetical protein
MLKRLFLYANTIKYLKLKQIVWRIYYKLKLKRIVFFKNSFCEADLDLPETVFRNNLSKNTLVQIEPLTFFLLNEKHSVQSKSCWNAPERSKLWLYNLHYHQFLLEDIELDEKLFVLHQWIDENPSSYGVAWEPYPLSLRIVNWVKFIINNPVAINHKLLESLLNQGKELLRKIEYHILGNHLFENAKALVFLGCVFKKKAGAPFLEKGLRILKKEIEEQILKDGLHFERSPMYHAIILEGMLDLYNLMSKMNLFDMKIKMENLIPKMFAALEIVTHPDNDLAYFNDSTHHIAATPQKLRNYAKKLGFTLPISQEIFLEESGFVKLESENCVLIADIGNIGPSYLPGHAHAESLSFECSLGKERLFVNSGISTYETSEKRTAQRSTKAHNCIIYNNKNSAEIWGSFRMGRRPNVLIQKIDAMNKFVSVSLQKIPSLSRHFEHKREYKIENKKIIISDHFKNSFICKKAYFHLHPNWTTKKIEDCKIYVSSLLTMSEAVIDISCDTKFVIETGAYDYAMGFNCEKKGQKITIHCPETTSFLQLSVLI